MQAIWSEFGCLPKEALELRTEVFVEEQGFVIEQDDYDIESHHLLITKDDKYVGVARVYCKDAEHYIGRICVKKEFRGSGIGAFIIEQSEEKIRELGGKISVLGAQFDKVEYYKRYGYIAVGEIFYEEHCKHIRMHKAL